MLGNAGMLFGHSDMFPKRLISLHDEMSFMLLN